MARTTLTQFNFLGICLMVWVECCVVNGLYRNTIHHYDGCNPELHVTGEPKSGTTWLEMIIHSLAQRACEDKDLGNDCVYLKHAKRVDRNEDDRQFKLWFNHGQANDNSNITGIMHCGKHFIYPKNAGVYHPNSGYFKPPLFHHRHFRDIPGCAEFSVPSLSASEEELIKANAVLARCIPTELTSHEDMLERFVLISRDPRDVAVSAYYYFRHDEETTLTEYITQHLPTITAWTALRFQFCQRERAKRHCSNHTKATCIMYHQLKTSLVPYKQLCEALGVHCSVEMLQIVKKERSAMVAKQTNQTSGQSEKSIYRSDTALLGVVLRSAGEKTLENGYGFNESFLRQMERYVDTILPEAFVQTMK